MILFTFTVGVVSQICDSSHALVLFVPEWHAEARPSDESRDNLHGESQMGVESESAGLGMIGNGGKWEC